MSEGTQFSREWAMPSAETFSIAPIRQLVHWHLSRAIISVDPFARNKRWATYTNDLNPNTAADHHMDAVAFLEMLAAKNIRADLILCDPPYSPRQISECYAAAGLQATTADTQDAALMQRVRTAINRVASEGAIVMWFGWNSTGMGLSWHTERIMLVCHGGAHNDTICVVQRRPVGNPELPWSLPCP